MAAIFRAAVVEEERFAGVGHAEAVLQSSPKPKERILRLQQSTKSPVGPKCTPEQRKRRKIASGDADLVRVVASFAFEERAERTGRRGPMIGRRARRTMMHEMQQPIAFAERPAVANRRAERDEVERCLDDRPLGRRQTLFDTVPGFDVVAPSERASEVTPGRLEERRDVVRSAG